MPTSCAASMDHIALITICSSITSISASILKKNLSAARTPFASRCSQDGARIQLDLHSALNVDKILLGNTTLEYERDSGAVFVDFPETLRRGPCLHHRLLLLGKSARNGPLRRDHLQEKILSGHTWINTACEVRERVSGGRTKINGGTKWRTCKSASRFPTVWWMSRTANSWARPISAMATPDGIGWSNIRSTITMCR